MGPTDYARQLLKLSVVQILQTIGFKGTHQIPLNLLVELLERYMLKLAKCTKDFAELGNRTEPTLDDAACALDRFKVSAADLDEFMNWVDTPEFALERHAAVARCWTDVVPPRRGSGKFKDKLNRCAESAEEAKERESDEEFEHVYDFMPLMRQPDTAADVQAPVVAETTCLPDMQVGGADDVQMASPSERQQQLEMVKRQLSLKAQPVVKRNGRTFSNYTWDSLFKPPPSSDAAMTTDGGRAKALPAMAKMPPYYHKPRIRQRKQHLLDLAANLNKPPPPPSTSIAMTTTVIDDQPAPKPEPPPAAAIVEEPINPVSTVKSADEVYTSLEIEKTAIVLEDILDGEVTTAAAEVKTLKLKIKEPAEALPAIPKLKIASLKKNLTSTATSSPMVKSSAFAASKGGDAAPPKRTESVVFDSSQIFAIDLGLDEEEDLASSIAATAAEEAGGEVVEQPISIKIKRTKDTYNAMTSVDAGGDVNLTATEPIPPPLPAVYRVSEQQAQFNYGLDGDNFDDNAMDGIDSTIAAKATARDQLALIWKPNKPADDHWKRVGITREPLADSDQGAPALAPFSIAKPKPLLSLVDSTYMSSNSNDSLSRPVGAMTSATAADVAAEDGDTRSSVVSNQPRVLASKDNTSEPTLSSELLVKSSKKNKEKKKSKDKDREKKKKPPATESIDENESAAAMSESATDQTAAMVSSSSKHKKKKKNKDKHKSGDKPKDKKHHHEKSKKGEEDNDSSTAAAAVDQQLTTTDSPTTTTSKKLDKKLKKQLKKQQKRLEKSANALVIITPDVNVNQEIDVETVHEHEESQAQNLINDLEAGEIRRPPVVDEAPRLPKIKLKIGGAGSSSTLVSDTAESPQAALKNEVVKPLKISLGKKDSSASSGLVLNFSSTKSELTTAEEEVELGEIVRPKPFSQDPPKLQPHPIPKLIIKPQKPASDFSPDDQQQQQVMFKLKHKDAAAAASGSVLVKKRKLPNQQIPQLQYTPQGFADSSSSFAVDDDDQVSALDLVDQQQFMNVSASGPMNMSFSKKQKLSSMSEASHSPPLLTPSGGGGQHAAKANQPMRIVSCRTEETSQQVWICPSCKKADKGSMIGCDSCDDWYHWKCVGITREPPDDQNWYCYKCGANDQRNKNAAAAAAMATPIHVDETGSVKSETFDDARSDTSELSVTYDANGELVKKLKIKKQLP